MEISTLKLEHLPAYNEFAEKMRAEHNYFVNPDIFGLDDAKVSDTAVSRWVVMEAGIVYGYARSEWKDPAVRTIGYILDPAVRGVGLANALVQLMIADARKHNMVKLNATVHERNYNSIAILLKFGFQFTDKTDDTYHVELLLWR
jgi:RimJ/RimL family protein N-acetyltransferase